ncbi:unnamed protein product, partial [Amoebophrya sp. A120]|eukprot:GSA120T00006507001.1
MPEPDAHLPTHELEWWDEQEGRTTEDEQMARMTTEILRRDLPESEWHGDVVDGEIDHRYLLSGAADFAENGHDYGDLDSVEFFVDMDLHFRFQYRGYMNIGAVDQDPGFAGAGEVVSSQRSGGTSSSSTPPVLARGGGEENVHALSTARKPSVPVPFYTYMTHRWLGRDTWLRQSD